MHCTMLVNGTFYVFLGDTKTEKCHQIRYSLPDVVLSSSISPDHVTFGRNKSYSENPLKRSSVVGLQKAGLTSCRG